MYVPETQQELLAHLQTITRGLDASRLARHTTASIAETLNVSRNLASQYLNDLARRGIALKVGQRPVYYFHKPELERRLGRSLGPSSFATTEELLAACGAHLTHSLDEAIGASLSLAPCIQQLRAALSYPPIGLPLLLTGAHGTGKSFLVELLYEEGKGTGLLPAASRLVTVDCATYRLDAGSFSRAFRGGVGQAGWIESARGGIVLFKDVDLLPAEARETLLDHVLNEVPAGPETRAIARPRFALTTTRPLDALEVTQLARRIPMRITLPSLKDRSPEEREELILKFLREEAEQTGIDTRIRKGALRHLINADLDDNIRGLHTCITTCCAEAYLSRQSNSAIIETFRLPPHLLEYETSEQLEDESQLIDAREMPEARKPGIVQRLLEPALAALPASPNTTDLQEEDLDTAITSLQALEDWLAFSPSLPTSRAAAYERIINDLVLETNDAFGTELSRKSARLVARSICLQIWPDGGLSTWKGARRPELATLYQALGACDPLARSACEALARSITERLGIELDEISRLLLLAHTRSAGSSHRRRAVGIILSHGYSTATSIADAANRILRARVFEALDMTYDQQVKDVVSPLKELIARHAYCHEIPLLVDMGSLEDIHKDLRDIAQVTLGVINNASTGLAVEVGAGLLAGQGVSKALATAAAGCTCRYRIVERSTRDDAILFCSEMGVDSAEKIRTLISKSLMREPSVRLVVRDWHELARNGREDMAFGTYHVRAIIGTTSPGVGDVPFIALEDVIAHEHHGAMDRVFSRYLSGNELAEFHQRVLKNLTLRNVVESITILNPETILGEIEAAIACLQEELDWHLGAHVTVGLHVHLCCLVERLVTKTPSEPREDEEAFEASHARFVAAFRSCFLNISRRYRIEVPATEIAYVYDYMNAGTARTDSERTSPMEVMGDE